MHELYCTTPYDLSEERLIGLKHEAHPTTYSYFQMGGWVMGRCACASENGCIWATYWRFTEVLTAVVALIKKELRPLYPVPSEECRAGGRFGLLK